MIPAGRTAHYAVWRACERVGIRPPDVAASWDDCNVFAQAEVLAFDQIRQHEEHELLVAQVKARAF